MAAPDPDVLRGPALAELFDAAADPAAARAALTDLLHATPDRLVLAAALERGGLAARRLVTVLGGSSGLADYLQSHPARWRVLESTPAEAPTAATLRTAMLEAVGADPGLPEPIATLRGTDGYDALRIAYRSRLLPLAADDLDGRLDVAVVAAALSDLAAATLEAALALARAELPPEAAPCRLAVIGMGKCGGRELNYVSDVDVIFVAEPPKGVDERAALATGARLAASLMRACGETTREGVIWPVDAALRPEGKAGPLVRTLASHAAYYARWAKTWEFQALLKARCIAGDLDLGAAYTAMVDPLVWSAAGREGFVDDTQAMRRRVEQHVPTAVVDRQLKLGPGGLRDVEFAVQLLQLVHGRSDPSLRCGSTIDALDALMAGGYVGREDGAELVRAYRFLRTLEHRVQLARMRRTHLMPESPDELRRLGRSMGFLDEPVDGLLAEWRSHATEVRRLHEKLFFRPLLAAVARLPGDHARLTPEAARERLEALGYVDPVGALRHLEALTAGTRRSAAIQRTLLPVLLGWFADGADPDAGLLGFREVSESLGSTHWYLRLLRDGGATAENLARVLAGSRYASELLLREPDLIKLLGDDAALRPHSFDEVAADMRAAVAQAADPGDAVAALRRVRAGELFRVAAADVLGRLDVTDVGTALSAITRAALATTLEVSRSQVERETGSMPARIAIIGMGRLGGREVSYGSDADALFLYEPTEGADATAAADAAHAVVRELRRALLTPGGDHPLGVDAGLRPEGRQGPLVRTLDAYATYYGRWSQVWETQALVRADFVAGDENLGGQFLALADGLRWPENGIAPDAVREIRRIKARMDVERVPRGTDPRRNAKLGPGGLADVEWTVQLIQLRHAGSTPTLRTTRTLDALAAAARVGLVSSDDAEALARAWRLASRVRNAVMLARGRAGDALPSHPRDLDRVARLLGYGPGESGELVEDYLRVTRRARAVVDRLFV